jgi:hypothetical protein
LYENHDPLLDVLEVDDWNPGTHSSSPMVRTLAPEVRERVSNEGHWWKVREGEWERERGSCGLENVSQQRREKLFF